MSFHFPNLTQIGSLLAHFAVPAHDHAEAEALPPLSDDHRLLRDAFLSGQVETRSWIEKVQADPVLQAHFG